MDNIKNFILQLKTFINKYKIIIIALLFIIILSFLPKFIFFKNSNITADYVNYYGMVWTSIITSAVTIIIFNKTLNENRRQLEEERKFTVKTSLYSKGYFNKGINNAFLKSIDENDINYFNDKLLDVETQCHIVWINYNFYENKDYNPIINLIKNEKQNTSIRYIISSNIYRFISNKKYLSSLYNNSRFFYYKLKNVGLNKALHITVYINNKESITNKYLSVDESLTLILILPREEETILNISICFSDVYGYKYGQFEKIGISYNKINYYGFLSEAKEIKEYGPLN